MRENANRVVKEAVVESAEMEGMTRGGVGENGGESGDEGL